MATQGVSKESSEHTHLAVCVQKDVQMLLLRALETPSDLQALCSFKSKFRLKGLYDYVM